MGAGLGGGSSDAAAVLLALAGSGGREVELPELCALAEQLGSDVPFFLLAAGRWGLAAEASCFRCRRAAAAGLLVVRGACFDGRGVPSAKPPFDIPISTK